MEDAQGPLAFTAKPGKKIVLDGHIYDLSEDSEESSEPEVSTSSKTDWALPQYSDGTYFPANYLEHETVVGYPSDEWPRNDGVDDVLDVVSLFEKEVLRCCILDVVALQYYGSERLRNVSVIISRRNRGYILMLLTQDWCICVPTHSLSKATSLLKDRSQKYVPFAPDCRVADQPISKWPRFKLVGIKLFVLLIPADEVRFAIDQEDSIVHGKTGLPFPSLPAFVQSLLDSKNHLDLEDIIDAMNLDEEWAAANGIKISDQPYPGVQMSPKRAWEKSTRTRQTRMGWRYDPKIYATRYRTHNDQDPRKTGDL